VASAAILAGGQARRFGGRDKGSLCVGGRSILAHQLEVLSQLTDDILLVGGPTDAGVATGIRCVPDRVPQNGPLAGLDAALAAARDDRVIIVACDMPFITAEFLKNLVALSQSVDAVVPRTERGYHPLCAVYGRSCHPAVLRRLAEHRLKMLELFEDLSVHVVDRESVALFGGERVLANVNTPDELRDLEAFVGHEL
jgi:molybdopterin-guanine dinucleotide biosynthesis protein A